jgi:hypothetical protein
MGSRGSVIPFFETLKNIPYIEQKTFDLCRNPKTNTLLRFDFYIPHLNLCIEYDGELHYRSSSIFGGDETLSRIKKNDMIKTNWCLENNIKLIRIPYKKKNKIFKILSLELK